MLELKIRHKGTDKYFYGSDIEAVSLESFELFKNEFDRGNTFKRLVKDMF